MDQSTLSSGLNSFMHQRSCNIEDVSAQLILLYVSGPGLSRRYNSMSVIEGCLPALNAKKSRIQHLLRLKNSCLPGITQCLPWFSFSGVIRVPSAVTFISNLLPALVPCAS